VKLLTFVGIMLTFSYFCVSTLGFAHVCWFINQKFQSPILFTLKYSQCSGSTV
jgi:hypothetical protein